LEVFVRGKILAFLLEIRTKIRASPGTDERQEEQQKIDGDFHSEHIVPPNTCAYFGVLLLFTQALYLLTMESLEVRRVSSSVDLMNPGEFCFVGKREPILRYQQVQTEPPQNFFKRLW